MKIHELPGDPGRQQKRKRVGRGRGSGHGGTSGAGHKGSQARSGRGKRGSSYEGGQIPLIRRLPKFGFDNTQFGTEYEAVNVCQLQKAFEAGAVVDRAAMKAARIVRTSNPVKILGNGSLDKALTIKADAFSKSAAEKIAAAGGTAETI
ncbi:50S ribosomal protein L15 [Candidatus Poribacteria bacterium]|nr:50S ribosomal protein L15 [Candidatus Poribacteria bacterium]